MPLTSWNDPLEPGRYHVEVTNALEKRSQAGDLMWRLTLQDLSSRNTVDDVVMLEGAGKGMGIGKLSALGITREMLPVEAHQLVGRRVFVTVKHETYQDRSGNDKIRAKVDGMYEQDNQAQEPSSSVPF